MQNFTFGRKGLNWFLFAFILFVGNLASYAQSPCATPAADQSYCYLETVDDLRYSGATNPAIYETADTENDTDPIDSDELLTDGETYFIGSTTENCDRVSVTVSVTAVATPENTLFSGRDNFTLSPCISSGFDVEDLEDLFNTSYSDYMIEVYDSEFGTTPLAENFELEPGDSYFVAQVYDATATDDPASTTECPSTRAAVGYDPTEAPTPNAAAAQTYCKGATVADLIASGTEENTQAIRWYRNRNSNTPLADDVALIDGEDYFAAQIVNDRNDPFPPCETEMADRARVVVEVISFDAGANVSESICQADLQARLQSESPTAIFLSLVEERNLPSDVNFSPSIGSIANSYNNDPFQTFTTIATFTTEEGCTDDLQLQLTVLENPDAGENGSVTLSPDDEPINLIDYLNGTPNSGGTWNPGDGTFDPSTDVEGDFTYTVENEACSDSATVTVIVTDCPPAPPSNSTSICNDVADEMVDDIGAIPPLYLSLLPEGTPTNGTFNPTISQLLIQYGQNNIQDFTTTYSYSIEDCDYSVELTVTVTEPDQANAGSFDDIQNVCSNAEPINLTSLTNNDPEAIDGGTFSGAGVSNNSFDPSTVETGNVTITYTVDDSLDCVSGSMETTFTIEIIQGSNAGQDISGSLCITELEEIVLPNLQNPENIIPALFDRFNFNGETGGTVESNLGNDFDEIGASLFAYYTNPNRDSSITIEGQYTVGNEADDCGTDVSNFAITIIDGELVDAGSDNTNNTLCNADIPGLVNSIPGDVEDLYFDLLEEGIPKNGTFNPSIDQIIADYNSDNFQTFSTTYTIGTEGCSDSVELAITVIEPGQAVAEAMDDTINVCTSETSYDLFNALEEGYTPGGSFSLNGEEFEGNIFDATTVEAGQYSFTYTVSSEDAECIEGNASADFTINVTSDFEFGNNITSVLCESEVPENLTVGIIEEYYLSLVSGLPSGGNFDTTAEEILTQYNNNPFDTFTATYTVDNGECQGSVSVSVIIQEEGPANAGDINNQVACTTDGMIALNQYLDGSGAQMGGTFSGEGVTDNMFNASIGANEEGYLITYSIDEGNSECIDGEDSTTFRIFVNEPGQAVAEAINDQVNVCTSETSYNLNRALSENSTLGGTFLLNGEEFEGNIFDATAVEAGQYSFTYTVSSEDAECIEGSASADFTINVTSETFDAGEDVTFTVCSVGLNATPTIATVRNYFLNLLADGVPTNGTFTPSIEEIREAYLADQIGIFSTIYTIGNGVCEDSVELIVEVTDVIPAEIGEIATPDPICRNAEDVDLFSFLPEDANTNGTFEGYEDGMFSPRMEGPGTYTITYNLTSDSPCTEGEATADFDITVLESAYAGMNMDLTVCMNEGVQNLFDFLSMDADATGQFALEGDLITDGMMDPADFEAGVYEVTYTVDAINDCGEDTAVFNITVQESPDAPTVDGDPFNFCAAEGATTANLSATGDNLTFYSDETLMTMVMPEDLLATGTYYVTQRIDEDGCESEAAMLEVNVNDADTPTIQDMNPSFCEFDDATLADLTDMIEESGTITWYDTEDGDNALNDGTSLQDGVTYYATLSNPDTGCESSGRLAVTVTVDSDECDLFIPEGFSPNGDTVNDEFVIRNIRNLYPNFTIEIRNRYGDLVYKGNANTPDWDGYSSEGSFGSDVLPVGAYFYYLDYNDGSTAPVRGTVYLSR